MFIQQGENNSFFIPKYFYLHIIKAHLHTGLLMMNMPLKTKIYVFILKRTTMFSRFSFVDGFFLSINLIYVCLFVVLSISLLSACLGVFLSVSLFIYYISVLKGSDRQCIMVELNVLYCWQRRRSKSSIGKGGGSFENRFF